MHAVCGRPVIRPSGSATRRCDAIANTFNAQFSRTHATVMLGGADEPLYLPAYGFAPARVFFRADFAASALHEAAHWCIAGHERRGLVDYGYRYEPPPRDRRARGAFFSAERNVQALECLFARSAGVPFRISADDFATTTLEREQFALSVTERVRHLTERGLPGRAAAFAHALRNTFDPAPAIEPLR